MSGEKGSPIVYDLVTIFKLNEFSELELEILP